MYLTFTECAKSVKILFDLEVVNLNKKSFEQIFSYKNKTNLHSQIEITIYSLHEASLLFQFQMQTETMIMSY